MVRTAATPSLIPKPSLGDVTPPSKSNKYGTVLVNGSNNELFSVSNYTDKPYDLNQADAVQYMYKRLTDSGFSHDAANGVIQNAWYETGGLKKSVEGGTGANAGRGAGLFQYTHGRRRDYDKYMLNKDPYSIKTQMDYFLDKEIGSNNWLKLKSQPASVSSAEDYKAMNKGDFGVDAEGNPYSAGKVFEASFERPNDSTYSHRQKYYESGDLVNKDGTLNPTAWLTDHYGGDASIQSYDFSQSLAGMTDAEKRDFSYAANTRYEALKEQYPNASDQYGPQTKAELEFNKAMYEAGNKGVASIVTPDKVDPFVTEKLDVPARNTSLATRGNTQVSDSLNSMNREKVWSDRKYARVERRRIRREDNKDKSFMNRLMGR